MGKTCRHHVRALPVAPRLAEPPEWQDLKILDAFEILELLRTNNLHTPSDPHPMWAHLSTATETFVAPKRTYQKRERAPVKLKRAERLRRMREEEMKHGGKRKASESSPAAAEDGAPPPQKKLRFGAPLPKKAPVVESQFRVQTRRAGSKNKKKKKKPNISGQLRRLDIQQVVTKAKTGNVPEDIGLIR